MITTRLIRSGHKITPLTEKQLARFLRSINIRGFNECWLWKGKKLKDEFHPEMDYGLFNANKKWFAHRLSWEVFHGKIPAGLCVCHRCDVPSCVNPHHLFVGTHKENMQDAAKKGRLKRKISPVSVCAAPKGGNTCRM